MARQVRHFGPRRAGKLSLADHRSAHAGILPQFHARQVHLNRDQCDRDQNPPREFAFFFRHFDRLFDDDGLGAVTFRRPWGRRRCRRNAHAPLKDEPRRTRLGRRRRRGRRGRRRRNRRRGRCRRRRRQGGACRGGSPPLLHAQLLKPVLLPDESRGVVLWRIARNRVVRQVLLRTRRPLFLRVGLSQISQAQVRHITWRSKRPESAPTTEIRRLSFLQALRRFSVHPHGEAEAWEPALRSPEPA